MCLGGMGFTGMSVCRDLAFDEPIQYSQEGFMLYRRLNAKKPQCPDINLIKQVQSKRC